MLDCRRCSADLIEEIIEEDRERMVNVISSGNYDQWWDLGSLPSESLVEAVSPIPSGQTATQVDTVLPSIGDAENDFDEL